MTIDTRITVAIPSAGRVSTNFMYSMISLMSYLQANGVPGFNIDVKLDIVQSSVIYGNRQKLVSRAIDSGQTHIMFIDDDMIFQPQVFGMLLQRQLPVVVTNYLIKVDEPKFVAISLDGNRVPTTVESTGCENVMFSGFGVSLFQTDVFKAIPKPWFMPLYNEEEDHFTPEDEPLFEKIRAAGYDVWLDHDASKLVAHEGIKMWRWDQV